MTMSPLSDRAVITAAAASGVGCARHPDRRRSTLFSVGVDHIGSARRQRDPDVAVVGGHVHGARRGVFEIDLDVAIVRRGAERIGDRDRRAADHVAVLRVRLDASGRPAEEYRPVVHVRDQLVEVCLRHQHPVLLLARDGEPARQLGRQHDLDLACPAPLQERGGFAADRHTSTRGVIGHGERMRTGPDRVDHAHVGTGFGGGAVGGDADRHRKPAGIDDQRAHRRRKGLAVGDHPEGRQTPGRGSQRAEATKHEHSGRADEQHPNRCAAARGQWRRGRRRRGRWCDRWRGRGRRSDGRHGERPFGGSGFEVAEDREHAAVLALVGGQVQLGEDRGDVLLGGADRDVQRARRWRSWSCPPPSVAAPPARAA